MANYGRFEYWEDRYQKDTEQFDWLQRYCPSGGNAPMRDLMVDLMQPQHQILVVGCGSSRMAEELIDDGFNNVVCIDMSYSAIKLM